ncbi:neuferricin [Epargyreus clarus]|uniref:neuferricin n=1 Tax=Epargyreus clarus TaxID=520877 RepID=UPI003C3019AF
MSLKSFLRKHLKIIVTIAVTIVAILCRKYISYFSLIDEVKVENKSVPIFSPDQLKKYNGIDESNLYLAVMGVIFDVTQSEKHYGKGAPYNYFVGKDGSRGFVTGKFKDESEEKDHILDLTCNELLTMLDWRKTFREKYPAVGLLAGRYYDKYGKDTNYLKVLKERVQKCKEDKDRAKKEEAIYPPCNISWSEDEGSKVWCTKSSGGVIRNWVGVPRQLFTPGDEKPRCVCIQLDKGNSSQLKKYDGCPDTSEECLVQDT